MTTATPILDSRKLFVALILLLTLLGLGLRFYRLSNQSLWTDEISSISVAQAPLDRIYEQSAAVNNSLPTYFLLLRMAFGHSSGHPEFRARWLSALAGTLSIPVFIGVVYLWRRHRGAALLAGLLLAANPLHIWYSQETRAYALMLFFGLLTLLFFELARESDVESDTGSDGVSAGKATVPGGHEPGCRHCRWMMWGLYLVSAVAAVALHKTALVFPAACCLWHGLEVVRRESRSSRRKSAQLPASSEGGGREFRAGSRWLPLFRNAFGELAVHIPVVAVALVVLMLKSYPPGEAYGRRESVLEIVYTFMTFVGGYSFGPSVTDIQSHGAWAAVLQHLIQVGVLFAVLSLVAAAFALDFRRLILGKEAGLLFMGIGVVAVYAMISGFPYNIRYTLAALLAFLALAAALITSKSLLARLAVAGMVLVGLWADGQWFYHPGYRKGDSRAVARWLAENKDRVKTWTVLPGYLSASVEWYLQSNPGVLSGLCPPAQDRTTSFPPVPDALIVGRRHHLLEPDKLISSYQSAAGEVRTNRSFTGFEIYAR